MTRARQHATREEWAQAPDEILMRGAAERESLADVAALRSAMADLSVVERAVVQHRALDGWSRSRTAQALNLTWAQVARYEQGAKAKLREVML